LETDYSAGKKPRDKKDHRVIAIALGVKEEPKDLGLHIRKDHRAVTTALGVMGEPKDPDLHIRKDLHPVTTALDRKEEINDPDHRAGHPTLHVTETPEIQ
jgi:hypothetical protein